MGIITYNSRSTATVTRTIEDTPGYLALGEALLCVDCETIYHMGFYEECPICSSESYIKLVEVLNSIQEPAPNKEKTKAE